MNMKINTICFILFLFLLVGVVNAADNNNETLQTIDEPVCEKLEVNVSDTVVSKSIVNEKVLTASASAKSKLKVNLKANNVKMHYKDGSKFKITLKDNNKKAMKNAKVKITINGATYAKTTDSKGTASVGLNFKSGTYKVTTTYDGSDKFQKQSVTSTVTIKSTLKCDDLTKYYKNNAPYTSKFYDKKGKLLKNVSVKFKLNGKTSTVKTNKNGIAKLPVDLKPGSYSVSVINSKTSESISKTITVKSILETHDVVMNASDGGCFKVKVLNSYGKASPNKKVSINVYGNTYTPKTDKNGIATLKLDLNVTGKYLIVTEYEGLKYTNHITVNKAVVKTVKKTEFTHSVLIPNYVNVTTDYVFHNTGYALKTGAEGIIKMSKKDIINITVLNKTYLFSQSKIPNVATTVIGYKYHLIPFDGSVIQSDFKKENLVGDGIILSNEGNFTQINYRCDITDKDSSITVGFDEAYNHSIGIKYCENHTEKVKINYCTWSFDESGLKYNLAKFYGENLDNFNNQNYINLTKNNTESIRYSNTNETVVFNNQSTSIVASISKEDLLTKVSINNTVCVENKINADYNGFDLLEVYQLFDYNVTDVVLDNFAKLNRVSGDFNLPVLLYGSFEGEKVWM